MRKRYRNHAATVDLWESCQTHGNVRKEINKLIGEAGRTFICLCGDLTREFIQVSYHVSSKKSARNLKVKDEEHSNINVKPVNLS